MEVVRTWLAEAVTPHLHIHRGQVAVEINGISMTCLRLGLQQNKVLHYVVHVQLLMELKFANAGVTGETVDLHQFKLIQLCKRRQERKRI